MKKSMWTAACAMLVLAGCSSSSSASSTASTASTSSSTTSASSTAAASGDTFTVGMECNYAPFNWQTTDATESSAELPNGAGYCDGYDVKISQDLADKLGKQLVVKKINWDGLQPALESGEIDAIVAGMTANDEREEGIDFTTPYYSSDMVMIVPKDSDVASFTSIQDFSGHKVIGQKNTNYDTIIDQIEGVDHVTPKAAYPELVLALQTGEAEAITAELPVAKGIVAANPDLTYITFEDGKGFDVDTTVSIGLKNNTRDTQEFKDVQAALDEISQETRDEYMLDAVNNAPTGE
ncbi:transporter substrate-binding domain-containing protein [Erysipelotrichaceae bacterium 51-3]|uniref:transporter substrate-binding domain-containing protein n=1 Tax=Allobaculum sp. JKK-2023 TaxID=3108943 RepID=UPI002B061CA7|nr:transporter substrate-binding domain-containing protein [Allobaculum sp. JKK-2023]